jgi:hypothetical protein
MDRIEIHRGHEITVLRVEEKHKAKQTRQESLINEVGFLTKDVPQQLSFGVVVRGLKPTQQFVQGGENLAGESGRDVVLILAAVGQEGWETLPPRKSKQSLRT